MLTKTAPVKIDSLLLERLQAYRLATGIPVSRSVNDAIKDFLDVVVPARLEALGISGISQSEKKLTAARKRLAS